MEFIFCASFFAILKGLTAFLKKFQIIACYVMHYIFYSGEVNYIRERSYT